MQYPVTSYIRWLCRSTGQIALHSAATFIHARAALLCHADEWGEAWRSRWRTKLALFESRDHGPDANSAFAGQVIEYLVAHKGQLTPHLEELWQRNDRKEHGSWAEVFGEVSVGVIAYHDGGAVSSTLLRRGAGPVGFCPEFSGQALMRGNC